MKRISIGKKVYDGRGCISFLILLIMTFLELSGGRSYFDEALCLLAMLYVFLLALKRRLVRDDIISIMILSFVIAIGLISNLFSGISVSLFAVIVDIIAETKILWIFFAAKYFIDQQACETLIEILTPISKVFIILAFAFSILSQFINTGMTGTVRYGIKGFRFIFPMSFQFLAVMLIMIAILAMNERIKNKMRYFILGSFSLIMATKSSPLLFAVMFLFFLYYFRRKKSLKIRTIILIGIIVLILGAFQIETYLLNSNAPRYLFFYFGGVTANRFFPFGSGFATFGSDQAARNYSQLYYEYGFNHMFGMNPEDGSFLSDTFWPMAIGQFGWLGFCLYCTIYLRIFFSFKKTRNINSDQKAFLYAGYFSYIIHAVGSAILSASAGVIGFIALAIVLSTDTSIHCHTECSHSRLSVPITKGAIDIRSKYGK